MEPPELNLVRTLGITPHPYKGCHAVTSTQSAQDPGFMAHLKAKLTRAATLLLGLLGAGLTLLFYKGSLFSRPNSMHCTVSLNLPCDTSGIGAPQAACAMGRNCVSLQFRSLFSSSRAGSPASPAAAVLFLVASRWLWARQRQ